MTRTKDYKDFKNFKDQVVKKAEEKGYDEVFEEFESRFGEKFGINKQVKKLEEVNRAYNLGQTKFGKSLYHLQEYGEKVKYHSAQFVDGLIQGLTLGGEFLENNLRRINWVENPVSWTYKAGSRINNRKAEMNKKGIYEGQPPDVSMTGGLLGAMVGFSSLSSIWIADALLELPKIYRKKKEDEKETMLAKIENY